MKPSNLEQCPKWFYAGSEIRPRWKHTPYISILSKISLLGHCWTILKQINGIPTVYAFNHCQVTLFLLDVNSKLRLHRQRLEVKSFNLLFNFIPSVGFSIVVLKEVVNAAVADNRNKSSWFWECHLQYPVVQHHLPQPTQIPCPQLMKPKFPLIMLNNY